jgi:hypothetical protein
VGSNHTEWEASIKKTFDEKVVHGFVQKHRTIALKAFQEIITDSRTVGFAHGSPVWSGRFAGSNKISVGSPDLSALPPHPERPNWPDEPDSPYGVVTMAEASIKLGALLPFDKVYISNNVPYAARLEDGYSPKAPEGIYGITGERIAIKYRNSKL